MRRVVVTGLGAITPLGVGVRRTWRRLLAGECGIENVATVEPADQWRGLPSTVAGLVPSSAAGEGHWRAADWISASDQRRMSKFAQYAVAASDMALRDAEWEPAEPVDKQATGVCLGSGIGALEEIYDTSISFRQEVRALG